MHSYYTNVVSNVVFLNLEHNNVHEPHQVPTEAKI